MNDVFFWLAHRDLTNKTVYRFARGSSGRNGTEQTVASITTAPVDVTWREVSEIPFEPMISTFDAGDIYPIWIWAHTEALAYSDEAFSLKDDPIIFNGSFRIGIGGTPTPGGGSGGGGSGGGGTGGGGGGGNPSPTPADTRIVFVGDEGCENETEEVIALINALDPDYLISVGDHAYESPNCWIDLFQDLRDRLGDKFQGAYGNHEYEENGGIGPYKTFFSHTKTYFTTTFQNIRFFFFDTNIDNDDSSTQFDTMMGDIESAAGSSAIDWKIVVMHHPWWVDGSRNEADEFEQIETYHQVFNDNGIDLVVVGHNHNFQRTHQLGFNSDDPLQDPDILHNTSPYTGGAGQGLIHVVTGAGGHDTGTGLYQLPSQPAFQAYQSRLYNGVWVIDVSNSGETLTCYFMNTDQVKFDEFVINRP
jgi:predicted phosphodiesterase